MRNRLRSKGISLPILCPMRGVDVEHILYIFFGCSFAQLCWRYARHLYDIHHVENASEGLLQKISTASGEELHLISKVLWGIWFFRNKKVWENKVVTHVIAMDWSFRFFKDWELAKTSRATRRSTNIPAVASHRQNWIPPTTDTLKLNVDASVTSGFDSFSIGPVIRD